MTQRVELATVLDRLAVDTLVTEYARAVAGGDPEACRPLCVPGAVLDDPVLDVREEARGRDVPRQGGHGDGARPYQHLIVNRRVAFERREGEVGDLAVVDADFVTPLRSSGPGRTADTVRGGLLPGTPTTRRAAQEGRPASGAGGPGWSWPRPRPRCSGGAGPRHGTPRRPRSPPAESGRPVVHVVLAVLAVLAGASTSSTPRAGRNGRGGDRSTIGL